MENLHPLETSVRWSFLIALLCGLLCWATESITLGIVATLYYLIWQWITWRPIRWYFTRKGLWGQQLSFNEYMRKTGEVFLLWVMFFVMAEFIEHKLEGTLEMILSFINQAFWSASLWGVIFYIDGMITALRLRNQRA